MSKKIRHFRPCKYYQLRHRFFISCLDKQFVCDGKKPGFDGKTRPNDGFFPSFDGKNSGPVPLGSCASSSHHLRLCYSHPEGLDRNFTRQMTGKTRHLGVFSRQNRVFSRHKQMSSPSGFLLVRFSAPPPSLHRHPEKIRDAHLLVLQNPLVRLPQIGDCSEKSEHKGDMVGEQTHGRVVRLSSAVSFWILPRRHRARVFRPLDRTILRSGQS